MLHKCESWFEKNRAQLIEDFFTYLKFPSISTDPSHKGDLIACQKWLASYMESIGLQVETWNTSGYPVIFGEFLSQKKEASTLLFYGHYDVQPAVPLEEWKSPPFEPEIRENKVYARGAIDNKGQCFYTLLGIAAFLKLAKEKNIHIKVVIEGEEENGSSGLEEIGKEKKEALQADHIFIVDVDMAGEKKPAVTLGMRGILNLNATVTNAINDLHSGVFGGIVLNPARALTTALAKMWNSQGEVVIPRFYEGIKTLTKKERSLFNWDLDVRKEMEPFQINVFQGEGDFSLVESNWTRPTLEINGIESGYTGAGFKTIIPAKAMAKLSCRLVPNQDPSIVMNQIISFLKKNLPGGIELTLEKGHGAPGFMAAPRSLTVENTIKAYEQVYQTSCQRILCGATIPIVPLLSSLCGGELVMIGVGLPTDGMHAPNECFALDRFKEGFLSITQILELFSSGG